MSYRLVDANELASKYPEVNDMPCVYADLTYGLDGRHHDMRRIWSVIAENTKLRQLVWDLWTATCTYDLGCHGCSHYKKHWDKTEECEFLTRMRELGIEV